MNFIFVPEGMQSFLDFHTNQLMHQCFDNGKRPQGEYRLIRSGWNRKLLYPFLTAKKWKLTGRGYNPVNLTALQHRLHTQETCSSRNNTGQ